MSEIFITEEARQNAITMQSSNDNFRNLPLRLYLEGKGCDGFYYGVTFDEKTEQDLEFPQENLLVICDPDTLEFCSGSTITWVDDERGRGFLVENPQHRKFRGKFYKRQAWQDKLTAKVSAQSNSTKR
ncbi:HesB/IscA family protein [Pseudobacteriovorax antillogorgiicola]|uniref:Iron-sulfur cluster insertion protein n=1 Tax=Pseudobacteriovorax antillogorgiicola TaxID=1513793 RepID=A0A1Y6BA30_9BACT|nr:iron-sulfur cluster assembly accessory protein [Pseudobacteriovorax antillogorgiicola]TCS59303.1 iron-sulfur cluster insertion protein [Pseudobacteriovorax antillogorgiicola]SME89588.1 iron-sulfur cluster insertion protein [Pseudobacteriovorax antillogorgiicola]